MYNGESNKNLTSVKKLRPHCQQLEAQHIISVSLQCVLCVVWLTVWMCSVYCV